MTLLAPAGGLVLLCRARARLCALPLARLVETMRPLPIVPVAGAPSFVRGLSRIRGAPVPVVDAGALLGAVDPASATRFVTVKTGGRQVALAFEEVMGIRDIPAGSLAALPPLLGDASETAVSAIAALDAELLLVLETARIVSDAVWQSLEVQGLE